VTSEPATEEILTTDTSATDEIKAMSRIVTILERLDPMARIRVVIWVYDRFWHPEARDTDPQPRPVPR
jgi:hypothetical protein